MNLINRICPKHILVVGDVMLDTYYSGDVNRISPEAPVPVFRKKSNRSVLGGAANVAVNLIAAGQTVSMMAMIGDDEAGKQIVQQLKEAKIDTSMMLSTHRDTTEKVRFMASNNQQIMRLDVENTADILSVQCVDLLEMLEKKISEYNLIVVSDYMKGFLSASLTQGVIGLARKHQISVIVDVKDTNAIKYRNAYLLKPNLSELKMLTGCHVDTEEEIVDAAKKLLEKCKCEYVLVTCGAQGMVLVNNDEFISIPSVGKEVFDVTGAGDTTIAYLAACLANGMLVKESMEISNYAAGIQVGKVGTSAVHLGEVSSFLLLEKQNIKNKLLNIESVERFRETFKNQKIVFTNGCFDILHVGHIRYLQKAASFGDMLVLGLNSDASVKRLKGASRPINTEDDRAELLCSLECIDYVVVFGEDTPYELIQKIQPDVLVKGGDYTPDQVVGKDLIEARGGTLELVPFVEGKSTTKTLARLMK